MIGRLNHVAIAVTSLAKGVAVYRDILGAKISAAAAAARTWRDGRLRGAAEHQDRIA